MEKFDKSFGLTAEKREAELPQRDLYKLSETSFSSFSLW